MAGLAAALHGHRDVVAADVDRRLGAQRAGEHPHERDPPDVGVGRGAHDLRGERAVRVGGERRVLGAVDARHRGQRVLQRRGEAADEHLQQRVEADAGGRADRDHRVERAAGDRGLQVVDQGGDLEVLAAEVAVHERLVLGLLDDALDQRSAGVLGAAAAPARRGSGRAARRGR